MDNRRTIQMETTPNERLARGLGWFSIGLGLAEVAAPEALARYIGVRNRPDLIRSLGMREIASGIGILTQPRPVGWVWSRVAGDIMDLSLLSAAMPSEGNERGRAAAALVAVAGVAVLDVACGLELSRPREEEIEHSILSTRQAITINRPREEIYGFWRNFENLPRFMYHLESVRVLEDNRSHWVAKGPGGKTVEWDAEIVEETPNESISWRSLEGADVDNAGTVRFETAPGGRGTIIRVDLEYRPPAGRLGAMVAKLLGRSPEKQVKMDLLRLKQMMETGEIASTEGQPAGRAHSTSRKFDDILRH